MNKRCPVRYPIEIGFYDTLKLSDEDRNFLDGRRAFFNYLVEQVEETKKQLSQLAGIIEIMAIEMKRLRKSKA